MSVFPRRVVVDPHGHYWRDYGDFYSMPPVSDENNETVVALAYVHEAMVAEAVAAERARIRAAVEGLEGFVVLIDNNFPVVAADLGQRAYSVPPHTVTVTVKRGEDGVVPRAAVLAAIDGGEK